MTNSEISSKELEIIQDRDFLLTKKILISKVQQQLEKTYEQLQRTLVQSQLPLDLRSSFRPMKISRGENYRDLPYLVLDYPALFSKEDVFAFRTMFWWGNFFSCTLHLQGKSLSLYRSKILENVDHFERDKYYMCVSNSPWEYHYGSDNYKLLSSNDIHFIEECSFLKLSKKIELDKWMTLPVFSASCLSHFLRILYSK